jgi:hypothetical protein
MHAQRIIQELLATECPSIHAKRRACVAAMAQAGSDGGLSLMGMSRVVSGATSLRHRIKRCDRMLGNGKLGQERPLIYGAMARRILCGMAQPLIIVDWSDLCADRSRQLLRAALIVRGRALTLYEEVHPLSRAASLKVHCAFLKRLQALLPANCRPVFITDAGFRSTWFALLDGMGYAWIGRIRNRDMVRPASGEHDWRGCKTLYARANGEPRDLGQFHYVRNRPVACRLVLIKKKPKGRHHTTVHKKRTRSARSKKQARAQKEPWLLAVSPQLAALDVRTIVTIYAGRMQIEQTFRDVKNPRWGLGLSESQTRKPQRLATLLLIGALACYALWLIGLAIRSNGYRIEFGSRKKAATALSVISLARWWMVENNAAMLSRRQLHTALILLRSMALAVWI